MNGNDENHDSTTDADDAPIILPPPAHTDAVAVAADAVVADVGAVVSALDVDAVMLFAADQTPRAVH